LPFDCSILDDRLRERRIDRVGEARKAIDDRDQDVAEAAIELVHHLELELGAFGLLDPNAENILRAINIAE